MTPAAAAEARRLLGDLAGAGGMRRACIPEPVRRALPALESWARELGLEVTLEPAGDEDLLCVIADEPEAVERMRLEGALSRFGRAPFLLVCGPGAPTAAEALRAAPDGWLSRRGSTGADTVVVAPAARMLDMPALAGEWQAGRPTVLPPTGESEALESLWQAVERDREALVGLSDRARHDARRLEEGRRARERLGAEVARLRAAERHELDRMRLALLEQRTWVAEQADRVAASTSWRVGHRLVRIARALALRRDRGTNLPERIAQRMRQDRP